MKGGRDRKVGGVAKARRMRRERRDERVNQYQSSDGAVTIWHVSRMASAAAGGREVLSRCSILPCTHNYSISFDRARWCSSGSSPLGHHCSKPPDSSPTPFSCHGGTRSTTALLKMPLPSSSTAVLCSRSPQSSPSSRATNSAGVAEAQYPRVQRPEGVFRAGTCAHMYAQHAPSDERNSSTPIMLPSFEGVKV